MIAVVANIEYQVIFASNFADNSVTAIAKNQFLFDLTSTLIAYRKPISVFIVAESTVFKFSHIKLYIAGSVWYRRSSNSDTGNMANKSIWHSSPCIGPCLVSCTKYKLFHWTESFSDRQSMQTESLKNRSSALSLYKNMLHNGQIKILDFISLQQVWHVTRHVPSFGTEQEGHFAFIYPNHLRTQPQDLMMIPTSSVTAFFRLVTAEQSKQYTNLHLCISFEHFAHANLSLIL